MMKTVFTVGVELPGRVAEYVPFDSDTSLLDADIVVFRPTFSGVYDFGDETYQGKRCYGEHSSFTLKERIAHWRRELSATTETGKTVFVLLGDKEEVYVDTGKRSYSGTGRNARTTRHVEPCCSYDPLPSIITTTSASGRVMILSDKAAILRAYWTVFGESSVYSVLITSAVTQPFVLSKDRKHVLGAIVRLKGSPGSFVLLPDIPFQQMPTFLTRNGDKSYWTTEATAFGHQFLQVLCSIVKGSVLTNDNDEAMRHQVRHRWCRTSSPPSPNHSVEANRRPSAPPGVDSPFGLSFSARPGLPAAVAHLGRSMGGKRQLNNSTF